MATRTAMVTETGTAKKRWLFRPCESKTLGPVGNGNGNGHANGNGKEKVAVPTLESSKTLGPVSNGNGHGNGNEKVAVLGSEPATLEQVKNGKSSLYVRDFGLSVPNRQP